MASLKIYKHTFTVVVLNTVEDYNPGLQAIAWDLGNGGGHIGKSIYMATEVVPAEKVADELVAVDDDGSFFSDPNYEIDNGSCSDECFEHASTCNTFCDHLAGHKNACLAPETPVGA